MKVVIVGASGNAGSSLIQALADEHEVDSILGLARRIPAWRPPKTRWASVDVVSSDLETHFAGADAVVHLAWLIQPSRRLDSLYEVNVRGSERVFRAVADAGVPTLVYASSVGAYSPGPKHRAVDESWPTEGIESSVYSRQKATVERILDRYEREVPRTRVVRLRPALIFNGEAASEIRRLFAGPFLPSPLADRRLIPIVPRIPGLRLQAVHSRDVGNAYRLAITRDVRGAFNVAAEPDFGPQELGRALGARPVPVPAAAIRFVTDLTWRLHLQPTPAGWLDMGLQVPLMDTGRARTELGWTPRHTALEALVELLEGIRRGRGMPTPPLEPDEERSRAAELRTGVGSS